MLFFINEIAFSAYFDTAIQNTKYLTKCIVYFITRGKSEALLYKLNLTIKMSDLNLFIKV